MSLFPEINTSLFWLGLVEFRLNNKSHLELEDGPVTSNNADPSHQKRVTFIISIFYAS